MEKLNMHSKNITDDNVSKIRELFPNCVTESRNKNNDIEYAVDFDALKQELSNHIVEGPQERYQLNWPGKREAMLTANSPIAKTLRPCKEESVNFDDTENLFIEGDNLDALKLLQETYLEKVKMIYIDPPYNTGKDFIYKDNFAQSTDEYLQDSEQKDEEGNRLVANTDSNGRFHSDWLSMMYSRLKLARNLLTDDGVIFISIDDCEIPNLRKLCDEIFGSDNFITEFIWKRRAPSAMADNNVSADHEYVISYQKGKLDGFFGAEKDFKKYKNPDNDSRGPWVLGDLTVGMTASMRPNQAYNLIDPKTGNSFAFNPNRVWSFIPASMNKMIEEGRVIFPKDPSKRPMQKRFKNELKSTHNPLSSIIIDKVGLNTEGTRQIQQLMGGNIFDYSKPLSLLTTLIPQICNSKDIVLDFFAGSGVTAHAVLSLNAKDKCKRKFIMVQLPEVCNEKTEAFNAGYKTIAEISKERIRRAGKKILEGECHKDWNKDVGFRVLKVDSSNMADTYYTPDETAQGDLLSQIDNIKPGRDNPLDLLFQVLLDLGVDLTLPISEKKIEGYKVLIVNHEPYDLIACFDRDINESLVTQLAKLKPMRLVFRDNGFVDDAIKSNVEQIVRQLSPNTDVKVI
ncbi:MAG: site-specific DNA-methyltransferase [Saccharospirillaceae bacterium]|nr:site-specific DNA-methyltransferase [Saccharospirillaceae bacterium]